MKTTETQDKKQEKVQKKLRQLRNLAQKASYYQWRLSTELYKIESEASKREMREAFEAMGIVSFEAGDWMC